MDKETSRLIGVEYDGNNVAESWTLDLKTGKVHGTSLGAKKTPSHLQWLQKGFLPDGYPDSVTADYLGEGHFFNSTGGIGALD